MMESKRRVLWAALIGVPVLFALLALAFLAGSEHGSNQRGERIAKPWVAMLNRISKGQARLTYIQPQGHGVYRLLIRDTKTGRSYRALGVKTRRRLLYLRGHLVMGNGVELSTGWTGHQTPSSLRPPTRNQVTARQRSHGGSSVATGSSIPSQGPVERQSAHHSLRQVATAIGQSLDATTGITTKGGTAGHLYAFIDANCPYCHRFYERIMAMAAAKRPTITWIPVAILKRSSLGKGAALLKGGAQALSRDEAHFQVTAEAGSIHPIASPGLRRKVTVNTMLLATALPEVFTPTILWHRAGRWHMALGDPNRRDWTAMLQTHHKPMQQTGEGAGHGQ